LFHYPDDLYKAFDSRNKITNDLKAEAQDIFQMEMDIDKKKYSTKLEENFRRS
jgi:hypothetical protein